MNYYSAFGTKKYRGKYTAICMDNHGGKVLEKLTAMEEIYRN